MGQHMPPDDVTGVVFEVTSGGEGVEFWWSDSARLIALDAQLDSGALPAELCAALFEEGASPCTVRPGPVVYPTTPGTSLVSFQFDLSERAIELLAAFAHQQIGVGVEVVSHRV